jgi:hypothetical protein
MPGLRAAIAGNGSALDVVHDVVTFQVQFFRDHPHFGRLYLFHSGHAFSSDAEPPLDPAIVANFEEAMTLQSGLFARGQRDGVLREGDPAVLSRLFSGLVAAYQETDPAITSDDPVAATTERLPLADLHDLVGRAFAA